MDLSLLLAIALLAALVVWLNRRRGRRSLAPRATPPAGATARPVRGQTQRQLLRLVGGNRAVAERLVEQVQLRNPGQSEQWCWEKTIYDIQRDRHIS